MSDMPRTIWASDSPTSECVISFPTPSEGYPIEYRRADLPPTPEQIMADPRVKSLVEALEQISDQHVPDQPAADGADEVDYIRKHHLNLRLIARAAIAAIKETK